MNAHVPRTANPSAPNLSSPVHRRPRPWIRGGNVRRPALVALTAAGTLCCSIAHAVRVNPDGHGQTLIYPYYTARATASGNAYVTALAVVNTTASPKAVRVRFLEGAAGAAVADFNLFLSAYDVWTAGVVPAGPGAGVFTLDNSCTTPRVSRDASSPTKFFNSAYAGRDPLGDGLDRTYEGYFEILEMGTIDATSALGLAVTQKLDLSAPNASKPTCVNLPATDAVPAGLTRPSGGLAGSVSLINVNEGTDYGIDAVALSQWSDKVQWYPPGNFHPDLADVSPRG